jgi:radical SAM superfamily enzyme YgiQ (UPF0313 family)
MPIPRYDLIQRDRLVSLPIQATRGCPYTCEFCSIIQFHEGRYRHRPVADIVRDFRAAQSRFVHFVDDNMMENTRFSRELFAELKGSRTLWGTQVTINVAKDPEMLRMAYDAGCRMLAVGVESISQTNLNRMDKGFTQVDRFREAFRIIQDAGIGVHALIVFGFPEDTLDTFDATIDFLESCGVAIAEFFIFTPYPKTPAGKAVWDAGQVTDTNLSHFRESYVVFKHPTLSAHELYSGYWHAMRRFYSWSSIAKRLARATMKDKSLHLAQNLNYWAKVRRGIVPVYFGRGNNERPTPLDKLRKRRSERSHIGGAAAAASP